MPFSVYTFLNRYRKKLCQDPRVKKHKIPDSGSATLNVSVCHGSGPAVISYLYGNVYSILNIKKKTQKLGNLNTDSAKNLDQTGPA
jgi:hypothetical protein